MTTERHETAVCVIEDDAAIRETLRALLEEEGYRVEEAANGRAGLALLQASEDRLVVLLDHRLPEMDGCDLLDIAAHDQVLRAQHVFILVTASPRRAEEDCGETLEELGAPLLPKPFSIDDLVDAVAEAARRIAVR
jgi:CheY-like chemotaxis protein